MESSFQEKETQVAFEQHEFELCRSTIPRFFLYNTMVLSKLWLVELVDGEMWIESTNSKIT